MERILVLKELVAFNRTPDELSEMLSKFDWDYEGAPLKVRTSDIKNVLQRYLAGHVTAHELEKWANLIECREDLEYEEEMYQLLDNVVNCLANPILKGKITKDTCEELLKSLG